MCNAGGAHARLDSFSFRLRRKPPTTFTTQKIIARMAF
jgi:hypothetical protein